ncbi:hypothetical protein C8Q75DRAFT_812240 [Abortiporus biennis]|nr:hypothetical protein C8Q75DRAFT_738023 [Abortiporus biennis]KAI0781774.1 hypothetical protein C8Q75DRAFT_812240 [Abortiporus biennis]
MKSFTALAVLSLAAIGSVIAAPYDESYSTFARRAPEPRQYRYRRSSYDSPSLNARSFDSAYSDLYARDYYEPSSVYRRDYASPMMDIYSRDDAYSAPTLYRRARQGGQPVPPGFLKGSTSTPPPRSNGQTSTSLPIGPPQTYYGITRSKPDAVNPANGGSSAQAPPQAPPRNAAPATNTSRGGQVPVAQVKQWNTAFAPTKPKQ